MSEEQIKLGNYTIPAKTSIQIPIYSIHHCEDYWPDHSKFDPERFLFPLYYISSMVFVIF